MTAIPPSQAAAVEALALAEEVVQNAEAVDLPLANVALKAGRLARLLNETDYEQIFKWEISGYPKSQEQDEPVAEEVWRLATLANRQFRKRNADSKQEETFIYLGSIVSIERESEAAKAKMAAQYDVPGYRPGSISIAIDYGRTWLEYDIQQSTQRLTARRSLIHDYATSRYYQLKYSGIATDVFSRTRANVDSRLARTVPDAVRKFDSAYENLKSSNPEDWANAVHSCRRILQDVADVVLPPGEPRVVGSKTIHLGPANYINRVMCYIEDRSSSKRFTELVGSHLSFLGDRLDAVFQAAQKGSHSSVTKEDADRFVIYTYLILGDILSL